MISSSTIRKSSRSASARRIISRAKARCVETQRGRFMWETNFVSDVAASSSKPGTSAAPKSSNMRFALADGTMHAHTSEMPVGTYKKGHRHGPDFHVLMLKGEGYSLFWYEGSKDFVRIDWQHGVVFAPVDQIFHQHFNTSPYPARYLALAYGSLRYPLRRKSERSSLGVDQDVKKGGAQIEYEDQDPRIHKIYLRNSPKTA